MFYEKHFDGNFTSQTHTSLKNISIFNNDSVNNLLMGGEMPYDFVSHIDNQLMCKEFDLTDISKEKIQLIRKSEQDKNFHLFIHQTGMFYRNELSLKYPSSHFVLNYNDYYNPQAKIEMKTYDLSQDAHIPCSTVLYQKCITKEIILRFNASFGCTYPIQRYLLILIYPCTHDAYCILFQLKLNRIKRDKN